MTPVATEGGAVQLPLTDPTDALLQTQYGAWYPHNRSIAPKSTILNLDEMEPDFVKWLDEDGLVLADANDTADPKPRPTRNAAEDDNVMSDASDEDTSEPQFPILNAKIRTVLADYGAIFPKLNWSAPLDAAWIMTSKTLKCQSPNDIYMLIKSSDFAMRDVEQVQALRSVCAEQARPQRPQLELVLKKWFEMPRSHEFRCFVRAGRLIAACQRDITYYEHLQDAPTQEQIVSALHTFFTAHLAPSETRTLRDMVFDVYLTRHLDRCFLIDVNPFLPRTDPLLWSFADLDQALEHAQAHPLALIPLRLITSPSQASQAMPTYSAHMLPKDVVDASTGESIVEFAKAWSEQLKDAEAD